MLRRLRSPIFLLILLVIGGPLLWRYWFADWLAERRWQEYVREAKARGLRWTLAEFRPAAVPAENDAAQLPVFASPKAHEALLKQVPILVRGPKRKDGALRPVNWEKTRKSLSQLGLKDDPAELDHIRALDAAAQVFQPLVDQLCQSKAIAGNWEDDVWKVKLDDATPHLNTAMACFRALSLRANLDLALGRPNDARRAMEAQLRLARVVARMPTAIAHLVALSGITLTRETVWRGMEMDAWDDDTLRAFAGEFLGQNAIADFQWSMETERAWSRELWEKIEGDGDRMGEVLSFKPPSRSTLGEWLFRFAASRPAWRRHNQLWSERAQDELATMLDGTAGVWTPVFRRYDPERLTQSERERHLVLATQGINAMDTFLRRSVYVHAQNQMAAIACALELARRATGKYPDTLEALVPAYLPRLPVDPTTGSAFTYRLQPDGTYRLYSLGFNREDDNGKIGDEPDRNPTDPDWPWFAPRAQPAP